MKFLVTATPVQVPLLDLQCLQQTAAWHQQHQGLGCMMLVQGNNCLAGMLEADSELELRRALDTYPDKGCYAWQVQAVAPMHDACARSLEVRTAPRAMISTAPSLPGSVFPAWMTASIQS